MFNVSAFRFKLLPSYVQGAIAGVLVFVSKNVIYISHNWPFVFAPAFGLVTGLVLIVAMVLGTQSDRALWESNGGSYFLDRREEATGNKSVFRFWVAFGSCIRVLTVALLLSGMADYILMNFIDGSLVEQTRNLKLEQIKNAYTLLGMDNETIDYAVKEIKSLNLASFSNVMVEVANKLFSNGLMGLIVAAFLRRKPQAHWVDS